MTVRFAKSYIDRLFAERDLYGIFHVISLVERDHSLPDEIWLFRRLQEWAGSTRSGVWQYYEGLPDVKFEGVLAVLERFELIAIAEQ